MSTFKPGWKPRSEMGVLNKPHPRVDGPAKVTGKARYAHDIRMPGMLYARLLCCPHPSAVAKLDFAPAMAVEGVIDAIALEPSETRFLGQPVAAVAAESPEAAEDGLRAIKVEWEHLDWALTPEQAEAEDAPQLSTRGPNARTARESGDLEATRAALESADFVVESTYRIPVQHHVCLETHGHVIDFDGENATVYASSQAVFAVRAEVADALGLPVDKVHVRVDYMGGGFGSKFGIGVEGAAACELAKRNKRPIHLMLTRRDEFLMAGNRSGAKKTLKGGATKDGKFIALETVTHRHGGFGAGSNSPQPYIYNVETFHTLDRFVLTNTDAGRAMRAPGHPQASFAIESMVDELAYGMGFDPVEFRIRNLEDPVYHRQLKRVAQEIGWYEHPNRTSSAPVNGGLNVGIGFGLSVWGGGGNPSRVRATTRIEADGSVSITNGVQDLGTGSRTLLTLIVAEEFNLQPKQVTARIGHSDMGASVGSGGSVTTASISPAIKDSAENAKRAFFERLAPIMEREADQLMMGPGGEVRAVDDATRKLSWREACSILGADAIEETGSGRPELAGNGVHGVQGARVEVDTQTGRYRVKKMVCVQDCGLPLNHKTIKSQMNGGMVGTLSFGMLEERLLDPWLGTAMNADLENYKVAHSMEIPEMVSIIDEDDTRQQVIGMAEPTGIPGHSAIANAIYNACGVRLHTMPFTPDKVLMGLLENA